MLTSSGASYDQEREPEAQSRSLVHTELLLTGISFCGVDRIQLAWFFTPQSAIAAADRVEPGAGSSGGGPQYYIDELYARLLVKPLIAGSALILWHGIDRDVIERNLDNSARGANEDSTHAPHKSGNLRRTQDGWRGWRQR